jgi:YD repeat-containing protein
VASTLKEIEMKRFICLMFIICYVFIAQGQIPEPPQNIPSPNAFSFVQYNNIPVSHFTGLPNINIPFSESKYKDVNLPIGLSYNYPGFRPEQHPGWVGMGWDLNVGGVITRTVKGEFPDEFEFSITPNFQKPNEIQTTRNGFMLDAVESSLMYRLRRSSPLFYNTQNPADRNYVTVPHKLPYYYNPPYRIAPLTFVNQSVWLGDSGFYNPPGFYSAGGKKDAFSDEYSFNFLGFSGKFILHPSGGTTEIIVQSNQNVKVAVFSENMKVPFAPVESQLRGPTPEADLFNYSPYFMEGYYPKTISGFSITADNGYTYLFGRNTTMFDNPNIRDPSNDFFDSIGIDYSIGANSYATDFWTADSWYLTRIVCPDGKKIDFEYQRKEKTFQEYEGYSNSGGGSRFSRYGRIMSSVYLSKIKSEFIDCDFFISKSNELRPAMKSWNYNDNRDFTYYYPQPLTQFNWYKLDSLKIRGNEIGTKSFKFEYNNLPSERLFLKGVTEYSKNIVNGHYNFSYDNSRTMPSYLTAQTDHWGYWNGKNHVGLSSSDISLFLPEKEPDFSYSNIGSLKQIKYPTGGTVNFEYEQNTYSKAVPEVRDQPLVFSANTFTGGHRVKRISHYDPVDNKMLEKKYFYIDSYNPLSTAAANANSSSSGISTRQFKYVWNFRGSEYSQATNSIVESQNAIELFSDQSILPVYDNYNVNYSKIFEVETNNGFTYYNYTNFDNGHGDEGYTSLLNNINSPYTKYSNKSLERGHLLEVTKFSNTQDTVSKSLYTYKPDRLIDGQPPFVSMDDGNLYPGQQYILGMSPALNATGSTFKFFNYRYLKDKECSVSYFGNKRLENLSQFFYDNPLHGQITRIKNLKSNGDTLITKFSYAADYTGFLPSRMVGANYLNSIIDKKVILKNQFSGEERILSGELYEYKLNPAYNQDVLLRRVYSLDLKESIPASTFNGFYIGNDNIDWNINFDKKWATDPAYKEVLFYEKYDKFKNPLSFTSLGGKKNAIVYNESNGQPALILRNRNYYDIKTLYTSFEQDLKGWISIGVFTNTYFKTGKRSFKGELTFQVPSSDIGFPNSNVDLWALTTGSIPIVTTSGAAAPAVPTILQTIGDWTLYRYQTSGNYPSQRLSINTNSNWIDELRVYGIESQVKSYTYTDYGFLTDVNDENGNITTYEYDDFGRLRLVKDPHGNIVKSYDYHYKP